MSLKNYQIIALVAVSLAVSGLIILGVMVRKQDKATSLNEKRIERKLHQKEKALVNLLQQTQQRLTNQPVPETLAENSLPFSLKELNKKGFSLFIYQNDSLNYWTNNKLQVAEKFSEATFKERIVEKSDGWYLTTYVSDSSYQIGGAFLIKHKYPYSNEFLKNNFHKDLGINRGDNYRIAFVEISFGLPIHDKNGNYLFSIITANKNGYTYQAELAANMLLFIFIIALLIAIKPAIENKYFAIFTSLIIVGGLRYLMMRFQFPDIIYSSNLFDTIGYNSLPWLNSTGDALLNALILFYFAWLIFYRPNNHANGKAPIGKSLPLSIAGWLGVVVIIFGGYKGIAPLILHSGAPLTIYQPLSLNFYTLFIFLTTILILGSILLISYKIFYLLKQACTNKCILITGSVIFILTLVFIWLISTNDFLFKSGITGLLVLVSVAVYFGLKPSLNNYHLIGLVFLIALYLTFFMQQTRQINVKQSEKSIVSALKERRDKSAENLLNQKVSDIRQDSALRNSIINKNPGSSEQVDYIKEYLQKNYFFDYLSRFELIVTICGPKNEFIPSNHTANCKGYYTTRRQNYGQTIPVPSFYFLETPDNEMEYLGEFPFRNQDKTYLLYISLRSKLTASEVGYPSLLTDESRKNSQTKIKTSYSYAKYENNELIKRSGNYYYDQIDRTFNRSGKTYEYIKDNNYMHLIYRSNKGDKIILTRPAITYKNHAITFSYMFVALIVLTFIFLLAIRGKKMLRTINLNFKNRIKLAMLVVLLLSFILIGGGTIYLSEQQFEAKHKKRIAEKLTSVSSQLEKEFAGSSALRNSLRIQSPEGIDVFLKGYSNVFQIDINIYNLQGKLLGSSRPEVFRKKLLSTRMHPRALQQLKYRHASRYIQNETIGKLEYASAYMPVYNSNNAIIGYLNLPYFTHPHILGQEISNMLVTVLNIYVLLLIITSTVAVIIANQATHPLYLLEQKFRAVRIGRRNEPIEYKGNDEIGRIVSAYNEMMSKLTDSIEKLAETEREMAWREMARQIAHEIRNPLTPMKLSIQHLQKSWKNNSEKFPSRFENTTQTLIEQIDTLSSIASEFSNFAKMPAPNIESFNVISRLENVILLFENTEHDVELHFDRNNMEKLEVLADKEQIQRVFINLIKNGIQSVPENKHGAIDIVVNANHNNALIKISDNGAGIPEDKREKLFRPSFTTKSGGMGMGLAIVKNIVEATNGKIWFDSVINQGTTFFVQLPLDKEHDR